MVTSSGRIVEVAESDLEGGAELEKELEAVLASVASLDDRLLEQRGDSDAVTVFDAFDALLTIEKSQQSHRLERGSR